MTVLSEPSPSRATWVGGCLKAALLVARVPSLPSSSAQQVADQLGRLVARLEGKQGGGAALGRQEALVLRLAGQYPGDVGVLSSFFLNHVALRPGEVLSLLWFKGIQGLQLH